MTIEAITKMTSKPKNKREQPDWDSVKETIKVLSDSWKTKLGKQLLLRHESIEALYKAHRAFVEKQSEIAKATASDNPNRLTGDAWVDKVMEFEELECELAGAICNFCYGEIEGEKGRCWPDLESEMVMGRIERAWDHRDTYWKDRPEELAAEQRQAVFRKGNRDAAKKLLVK